MKQNYFGKQLRITNINVNMNGKVKNDILGSKKYQTMIDNSLSPRMELNRIESLELL
jgi:hypothetical protein